MASVLSWRRGVIEGDGFRIQTESDEPITVLAYGKAAARMARALLKMLPQQFLTGTVVVPAGGKESVPGLTLHRASHPIPDGSSFAAGRQLLRRMAALKSGARVFHLISGGASALLAAPLAPWVSRREKTILHRLLVASDLRIDEINLVRKHFSAIKGGRLLLAAPRARQVSLILSDAPPGRPDIVGGGPTLPDPTSWSECREVMRRARLFGKLPPEMRERLRRRGWPETPKPGDRAFESHVWALIGSSEDLLQCAAQRARQLGYRTRVVPESVEDPPEPFLDRLLKSADDWRAKERGALCIVAAGEVRRSRVPGRGIGGRALDLAAAAASRLEGTSSRLFLAAGSDGVDGNSPLAGAMVDDQTLRRARRLDADPGSFRRAGDTFRFFQAVGGGLRTGPTGNNLRDLYLLLDVPDPAAFRAARPDRRES